MSPSRLLDFAPVPPEALWLRPVGILRGAAAAGAMPLAGGPLAFAALEVLALHERRLIAAVATIAELREWAKRSPRHAERVDALLARLAAPRPAWAGLALDRPRLMGVLNVTPDSFSDGGDFIDAERAIEHGKAMMAAGADIIDVGGESTRPGAAPVPPAEEIRRVAPVIATLAAAGALVSIDTRHAAVMHAALEKGARIVNDVTALSGDPGSLAVAAGAGAAIVLMHMKGEPRTMQKAPVYDDAPVEVTEYLAERIAACRGAGIAEERIAVDSGIGFGKGKAHNLAILERLALLHALGTGILLGVSRKSIIGKLTNAVEPKDRLPGSLAGALHGLSQGVQILRVHDVAETRQAIAVWQAIAAATTTPVPSGRG
jgi:dihydropteroate synthase